MCCDSPNLGLVVPTMSLGGHGTANMTGNIAPARACHHLDAVGELHGGREFQERISAHAAAAALHLFGDQSGRGEVADEGARHAGRRSAQAAHRRSKAKRSPRACASSPISASTRPTATSSSRSRPWRREARHGVRTWTSAFAARRRCCAARAGGSARPARSRSRTRASTSPSWRASATCWSKPAPRSRRRPASRSRRSPATSPPRKAAPPRSRPVPAPDILLNNADGPLPGDFRDWSRDDWIAALDSMMLGPIEMMRLTVDGMMARGFGRIVNIVSRSVKIPQGELGLSNGARSGLVGFVGGLARQTVARDVTDQQSAAGHLRQRRATASTFAACWRERARRFERCVSRAGRRPIRPKRYGQPAELGAYCAFLCSVHAGFITGQNLLIDGGSYPGTY